tara:strand:- start:58610 stop:59527 length:918 start_codon:yes stop_codon:yes gene_type:complete
MDAGEFMAEDSIFVLIGTMFAIYMAIRSWTKGAMSLLWALSSWLAGGLAGWWACNNGLDLLRRYGDVNLNGNMTVVVSIGLAIITFSLVRLVTKACFLKVFGKDSFLGNWMYGGSGAVLSLLPTAAVLLLLALLVRVNGTMWELNEVDKISARAGQWSRENYPKTIAAVRWRNAVENLPKSQQILNTVDPITPVARRNLAHLLIASYHPSLAQQLRSHKDTREIAKHPAVMELYEDPEINTLIAGGMQYNKYFDILRHRRVRRTLKDYPDLRRELSQIDMADEIRAIITGTRSKKRLPWIERIFT